jgi:hypothetical protein
MNRCSWNATGSRPCLNDATHVIGEYLLCDAHDHEITARVSRDYPINLPAGSVDDQGDAFTCATEECTSTPSRMIGAFHFCSDCAQDLRLPSCEPYQAGESVVDHGARVLAFILQTDVTATLSDDELIRAEIAAKYAIQAKGISVPAADRISDVRHVIAFVLRERQAEQRDALQLAALGTDRRPNIGPMAPLLDRPIVQPPAPEYARPGKADIRF